MLKNGLQVTTEIILVAYKAKTANGGRATCRILFKKLEIVILSFKKI
jgi:hypothetical protein